MRDLFIDGGAYGLIYYIGVTSKLPRRHSRVYGLSAGALVGAMYLLGYSTAKQSALYHSISDDAAAAIRASPFDASSYNITPHHLTVLKTLIDAYPDAYQVLTRRLYIGVSLLDDDGTYRFVWKSRFRDNVDLCHSLLGGFHIPFLCQYTPTIDGACAVDGVVAFDASRHLPERTLRIGIVHEACAHSRACYHIYTCASIGALLRPMAEADRRALYHRGRDDARAFLAGPSSPESTVALPARWDAGWPVSRALRLVQRASLMAVFTWLRRRQRPNAQYSKRALARLLVANARSGPRARTVV